MFKWYIVILTGLISNILYPIGDDLPARLPAAHQLAYNAWQEADVREQVRQEFLKTVIIPTLVKVAQTPAYTLQKFNEKERYAAIGSFNAMNNDHREDNISDSIPNGRMLPLKIELLKFLQGKEMKKKGRLAREDPERKKSWTYAFSSYFSKWSFLRYFNK